MFEHLILPWLLPIFGMFFAAGADALGGAGGEAGAEAGVIGDAGEVADADLGYTSDADEHADAGEAEDKPLTTARTDEKEEPEVQEFRGAVSNRLRGLVKNSPKLAEAFKENPKLQEQIEATFRREAALRELFPTVAEARQLREALPNGLADLQALQGDIKEVEALDNDFYTRDREGNYPGHARIVENMFRDDREAAVSLFRSLPKQWAQLDRDSYNEVMGKIVGATFAGANIPDFLGELIESAKEAKHDGLVKGLTQLANWAGGFLKDKPQPSEEEQRLSRDRQNFAREKEEREKADGNQFHQSFVTQSRKLQGEIIKAHPAVQKLLANKTITEPKKAEILEQVRKQIESLLGKSPSFMGKLRPAYSSRNMQEIISLQKAAWSEQWRLNSAIRKVFGKEIPELVSQNRAVVQRRAGTQPTSKLANSSVTKKGPVQIQGRWYRDGGRGAPYTTAEVLAGKHLEQA